MKRHGLLIVLGALVLSFAGCATDAEIIEARKKRVGENYHEDGSFGSDAVGIGYGGSG